VREWLSNIDKDAKAARDKRIFDMWMACYTQEEIAEATSVSKAEVNNTISSQTAELPEVNKPAAFHQTDFHIPLYNVWAYSSKSTTSNHFGNTNDTIVDNLLYLYTLTLRPAGFRRSHSVGKPAASEYRTV